MIVKKFYASTTREALRLVRDALGPDALILSNRQVPGGIEIMAVADADVAHLTPSRTPTPAPSSEGRDEIPASVMARPHDTKPSPARATPVSSRPETIRPETISHEFLQPPPSARPVPEVIPRGMEQRLAERQRLESLSGENPPLSPRPVNRTGTENPHAETPNHGRAPANPPAQAHAQLQRQVLARTYAAPQDDDEWLDEPVSPQRFEYTEPLPEPVSHGPSAAAIEPRLHPVENYSQHEPVLSSPHSAMVQLDPEVAASIQSMAEEVKFLRTMMEGQLAGFAWSDLKQHEPEKLEMLRRMLALGFSPALSRQLMDNIPSDYRFEQGMKWMQTALLHNLKILSPHQDLIEQGGVYALVGPTGVGKTTTVAKLAARCTLKHGAEQVALITTDSYRIGAHDQLRIYGKILGVPVYSVKDEADLELTLSDLGRRFLILIDTVGMSQRDKRLEEQIHMLSGGHVPVRRLLLLSANTQAQTMDDVVKRYQGEGLTGSILTKIDEAVTLASALDVLIRNKLTLYYVANGQRVPEDLHLANPLYLMDRAMKWTAPSPAHMLQAEEYPVYMGASHALEGVVTRRKRNKGGPQHG